MARSGPRSSLNPVNLVSSRWGHGVPHLFLDIMTHLSPFFFFVHLVTKQLVKAHDVNFGVRSVLYEVEKMAVRLIAEAQIRGEIGYG